MNFPVILESWNLLPILLLLDHTPDIHSFIPLFNAISIQNHLLKED